MLGILFDYDSSTFATILHPSRLITWVLFLVLGFTFLGYIHSALGALCNEIKDTMSTLYPLAIFQFFGVLPAVIFVMFAPDSKVAQILTFIPLLTPSVMVSRSAALPNWPVYLVIVLLMCISIVCIRKYAAAVYTHGISSDRSPKGLGRIIRLARKPV